jgi:hypothetical protein
MSSIFLSLQSDMNFLSDFFGGKVVPMYAVYIIIGMIAVAVIVILYIIYERYFINGKTKVSAVIPPEQLAGEGITTDAPQAQKSCSADRLPEWRYGEHQVYYYPVAHEYTPLEADLVERGWTQQGYTDNVPLEQKLYARQWFERQSHYAPQRMDYIPKKQKFQSSGAGLSGCECIKSGYTVQPFTLYQSKIPKVEINPEMEGYPIDHESKDIPALTTRYSHEPCDKFYTYQRPSDNRYHITETVA